LLRKKQEAQLETKKKYATTLFSTGKIRKDREPSCTFLDYQIAMDEYFGVNDTCTCYANMITLSNKYIVMKPALTVPATHQPHHQPFNEINTSR